MLSARAKVLAGREARYRGTPTTQSAQHPPSRPAVPARQSDRPVFPVADSGDTATMQIRHLAPPVLALALALTGCGGNDKPAPATTTSSTPTAFTVNGVINIQQWPTGWQIGADCQGAALSSRGYPDLVTGAQVVVTDASGKTIAVGQLEGGSVKTDPATGEPFKVCAMRFNVTGVPRGQGFYGVEVAHRGRVQFDEVKASSEVTLTIG
jgi:hypothetical protein